jgi:peptidyl-prolyl cis-trans isomerase C
MMKHALPAGFLALAIALVPKGASPQAPPDAAAAAARRNLVVAHLGTPPTSRDITVGELEDRLADLPPFQRATFGDTPDLVRRAFLMQVLVPEALFALGGEAQKLAEQPRTAHDIDRALSNATLRALREQLGPSSAVPMQDVQQYYDENRAKYDTPERYQVWRILCKTRDDAAVVLDQARKDPTPKTFGDLAREHSLDKATNLRQGNLGFLTPDGTSNEPGLRVDPAVVRAARGVHDGEFVPAPVPEGEYFSVVWRRGTIAAFHRTVDEAAAQIRDVLWKARLKKETDQLVEKLQAAKVRDLDPSLLDTIDLPADPDAGGMALRRHAPPAPSSK